MSIFEFFLKLSHPAEKRGWEETTAVFTGRIEEVRSGAGGGADHCRFEIRYYADDKERFAWYEFYPVGDPDPEELTGTSMRIRYNRRRPWQYEFVS